MRILGSIGPDIVANAEHWNHLANEQDKMGDYEASRGHYDGVHREKAALYRRTVVSLFLQSETGVVHCVDHLLPIDHKRDR